MVESLAKSSKFINSKPPKAVLAAKEQKVDQLKAKYEHIGEVLKNAEEDLQKT